jgi:hypothetical protein
MIQELDAADLDHPIAAQTIEASRLRVEHDLAHAPSI